LRCRPTLSNVHIVLSDKTSSHSGATRQTPTRRKAARNTTPTTLLRRKRRTRASSTSTVCATSLPVRRAVLGRSAVGVARGVDEPLIPDAVSRPSGAPNARMMPHCRARSGARSLPLIGHGRRDASHQNDAARQWVLTQIRREPASSNRQGIEARRHPTGVRCTQVGLRPTAGAAAVSSPGVETGRCGMRRCGRRRPSPLGS